MPIKRRPVKSEVGCQNCVFREGEFWNDVDDNNITRCYCNARHFKVNATEMSKWCDFYSTDPAYKKPKNKSEGI